MTCLIENLKGNSSAQDVQNQMVLRHQPEKANIEHQNYASIDNARRVFWEETWIPQAVESLIYMPQFRYRAPYVVPGFEDGSLSAGYVW